MNSRKPKKKKIYPFIPRWMPLKMAVFYGSINEKGLIKLVKAGKIKGFQDPDTKNSKWIIDRDSIDAYRESQMDDKDIEDWEIRLEAREILERMGYRRAPNRE